MYSLSMIELVIPIYSVISSMLISVDLASSKAVKLSVDDSCCV